MILLSSIIHYVGQAVLTFSRYLRDMIKKTKFEHRTGAFLSYSFFLSGAPVLCSNNNKRRCA